MIHDAARHGTYAGYMRHRRDGEDVCGPCRVANARHDSPFGSAGETAFDPDVLVRPPEWTKDAACIGEDPETFFPKRRGKPAARGVVAQAKAVCGGCPVRDQCLEYALTIEAVTLTGKQGHHAEMAGIWGGLTVHERQAILRQRHQAAS